MLGVLRGFIQEELADQRTFLQLSRWAPVWARQELKAMAEDAGNHAKRLCAACYLITGHGDYPTALIYGETLPRQWQAALRERYHSEACNGLNYARAAEDTTDPCLSRLLRAMSMDEYRHADQLMTMLQRSL